VINTLKLPLLLLSLFVTSQRTIIFRNIISDFLLILWPASSWLIIIVVIKLSDEIIWSNSISDSINFLLDNLCTIKILIFYSYCLSLLEGLELSPEML
jgi:hypothetical protein